MTRTIDEHRQRLKNQKRVLEDSIASIRRQQLEVSQFQEEVYAYGRQIARAQREGLDGFDEETFGKESGMSKGAKARVLEILEKYRRKEHDECEDPWYSCPSHPEYVGQEPRDYCNCGMETSNAFVDEAISLIKEDGA